MIVPCGLSGTGTSQGAVIGFMQYGSVSQDGNEVHSTFVILMILVAKLLSMSHGGYDLTGITSQDGDKAI